MSEHRFTGRKPSTMVTPLITPARPRDRYQSQVHKHAEAQRTHDRHLHYAALLAVSFVVVLSVLVSFVWLSSNVVPDIQRSITIQAGAR